MAVSLLYVLIVAIASVIVFVSIALRGRQGAALLSEPRCAKCSYDLRGFSGPAPVRCSECGADLTQRHAVLWGTHERKPLRIWFLFLLASPALILFLVFLCLTHSLRPAMVFPGTPAFAAQSNAVVLASLASSTTNILQWQELQKRLSAGTLSNAEIATAIDTLIAHLKKQSTVQPLTMSWAEQFVSDADTAGKISDEQYLRLARAFYKNCIVTVADRMRSGSKLSIVIQTEQAGPWQLPGAELVFALRQTTLSGAPVTVVSLQQTNAEKPDADYLSAKNPGFIGGSTKMDFPPGKYNLTFTVDVAVLRVNTAPQIAGDRPGQVIHWPNSRAVWSDAITAPLCIVPVDESPVALVSTPAMDPQKTGALHVNSIRVIRKGSGQRVTVDFSLNGKVMPCSFDVILRIAGVEHRLGEHVAYANGSMGGEHACDLQSLDPNVHTADVLFRPNVAHAENIAGIDCVWGLPIDLTNIPIERFDLQGK